MATTLAPHISFIQSPLLTKIIGLDSDSSLVFVIKISTQSKMLQNLACVLVQGGLVMDYIAMYDLGHFSLLQGHFWIQEKKIHDFFGYQCVFKMKLNNFLVASFLLDVEPKVQSFKF